MTPAQADPALAGDAAVSAALAPATNRVHARSPAAPPSPARGKRARGGRRGAGSGLGATPPAPTAAASTPAAAGPPMSRAAIAAAAGALRRAAASPPPARNVFLTSSSGAAPSSALPHALGPLPLVSRYRAEFREVATLGSGAFSTVSAVLARFDGAPYAVKRCSAEVFAPADRARWQQEAQAMAAAGSHPGLARYYSSWSEAGPGGGTLFYIQLERCGVSLATLAAVHGGPLPEPALLSIARQAAAALAHLHARGIAHGDVKPDNMLTAMRASSAEDGGGGGGSSSAAASSSAGPLAACAEVAGAPVAGALRLADFGMASPLAGGGAGGWVAPGEGDARYLAPELLDTRAAGGAASSSGGNAVALDKVDAFALGASLYELAAGRPLPSSGPVWAGLRAGRLGLLPASSAGFRGLVKALMAPSPGDRPALAAVLRWPVLVNGGGGGVGWGGAPPPRGWRARRRWRRWPRQRRRHRLSRRGLRRRRPRPPALRRWRCSPRFRRRERETMRLEKKIPVHPCSLSRLLSLPHRPMDASSFTVKRLFRDCLRLADYISTQVCEN